ncbi:unnamed protein product, partial [Mesorhabditis spiculigera]
MCTYAPTLILLNLYCIWLIYRQEQLTTNVKFILILDPGCRLFEALATLYKAPCLLNYWCVEVYAPFLSNAIITSSQIGMTYSTQLLGNALSFYRFFAIFFDGRLYRYAEKIAVPHALLAWVYNPLDDFTCYGGLHWDPQNYTNMIVYLWNWSLFGLLANIDYVMYGVLVVSLTLDLCTFFMLRRFVRKNVDRKRADRKLAVMLIVTHVITAFFFLGKYLASDYEDYVPNGCSESEGFFYTNAYESTIGWDGLPNRDDKNQRSVYFIFAAMCTYGPVIIILNVYCIQLIYRRHLLTKSVKFILIIDAGCRLFEGFATVYKAPCLLNYWCVEVYGPFLSNAIITSGQIAMTYSAQLLGNALSINRFFAIFLDGMFYRYAERLAFPHALLAWAFPVALFCGAIGNLYNPREHFTCYGGLHWDPLNYTNLIFYTWAPIMFQFLARLDYFMYGVLALSLVLDLSTFFKLRKFVLHANDRKRSDRKVAVMLIVTHSITGIFFIGNFLTNTLLHRRETLTPVQEYIINEGAPVIGHVAYTLVVTLFNRPPREDATKPKIVSLTESSRDNQSKRLQ